MKRITSILIVFFMALTMCVTDNAANTTIKLVVNGKIADLKGYNPYKSASGIMLPLAEASKAAGATVEYDTNTKEAKIKLNQNTLVFRAGNRYVLVNGRSFSMPEYAVNIKGKIYVPARFLFEKLGGTAGWDDKTQTVAVSIKLPSDSSKQPDKVSEDIDILMPASPDFKPYIAELAPIDPDVLKELQAYKDDKDGELQHRINGVGINMYMSNAEVIKSGGIEEVKRTCVAAKSMLETENNVDYRTIDNNFIQQYRYSFTPLSESGDVTTDINLIIHRYQDIKNYKIVQKAEFYTDTSLIYVNKNGETRIRGKLKFMFESVDKLYFRDHSIPEYELNKWYESDLEIVLGIFMSKYWELWPHSYYTYMDRFYLNKNRLSYDK